jgi:hypothetical protein
MVIEAEGKKSLRFKLFDEQIETGKHDRTLGPNPAPLMD